MNAQKHLSPHAWAELVLLGIIWGASFVSIRIALDTIPVMTSVLHRTFWAMLVLWLVVWAQGHKVPRAPRVWGAFLIMALLNNAIPFSLMAWGQLYIDTGLTAILNATTAVFGVLVAALFFRDERLTRSRLFGVCLGFIGVTIAIGIQNFIGFSLQSTAQLAVLAGTVSYAFAAAWARYALSDLPPIVAAAGMLTGSTILVLPLTLMIDGWPSLVLPAVTWAAIAYYAIVATAGAYLLYYRVLAMAGSGNLMLVTLVIPPVAIVLGSLLRGEALPPNAYLGFGILATGLLVLNRSGRRD
ncbi:MULTISPECIES: DMT family transporter [unclassified Ruegeria]|uniref:DMT family transporter n=1 Tax=unclassified Ruegeria TaxID=2625375 RepID=UPI00149240B7|nr:MULTISPECIES: DMT family transporter [unclassified Ruegeria]NOD33646.1 EamA family transporter [Ruegeria sp. HKCCD7296]NOE40679.1 EamA family transporter [Ruegeria sp. HKCCD7319]